MSLLLQRSIQYALVTLASALAVCLLFVFHAPATTSETRTDGGTIVAAPAQTQTFTAAGGYTMPTITRDIFQETVPNYGAIRVKAIAYAKSHLDTAYAAADAAFPAQQKTDLQTLRQTLKKAKTATDKTKITAQIDKTKTAPLPSVKEWTCLDSLWTSESGWQVYAVNTTSGAYGIAQALPAEKMATTGGNWADSYKTQITWGLKYISDRYGDPCSAWQQWQQRSPHWY